MSAPVANLAAERRVLSSLIRIADAADLSATDRLLPSECYHPDHSALLATVYAVHDAGGVVDPFTMRAALSAAQAKRSVVELLEAIELGDIRLGQTRAAVEEVRAKARARAARESLMHAIAATERGDLEAATEHTANATAFAEPPKLDVQTAEDCARAALAQIHDNITKPKARTGFRIIDDAIFGLRPATMVTIGGTTGAGKSSTMLAIAIHLARIGYRPGIVSCEDADSVWGERVLAHVCDINPNRLHDLNIGEGFKGEAYRGLEEARRLGMRFAFTLNQGVREVVMACRSLVRDHGCDVLFVDYVQAIKIRGTDRRTAVSNAAQDVKAEAQALNVPLILASQLRRPPDDKPFREPHQSELKESGDLENMSEVIVLLWKTSDEENAETHGKITKVKWSNHRPRFKVERSPTGCVTSLVHREAQKPAEPGYAESGRNGWGKA